MVSLQVAEKIKPKWELVIPVQCRCCWLLCLCECAALLSAKQGDTPPYQLRPWNVNTVVENWSQWKLLNFFQEFQYRTLSFSKMNTELPSEETKLFWVVSVVSKPGDSNHPARHHPNEALFNCEKGCMWTTIAERNPKPLGAAKGNINTELSRGTQHTEGQQIWSTACQRLDKEITSK